MMDKETQDYQHISASITLALNIIIVIVLAIV